MSAYLGSQQISQITRATITGSSDPFVKEFPRSIGALLLPRNEADRQITLACSWHVSGQTKTQIEELHHDLNEEIALRSGQDLSINGNIFESVIPISTSFQVATVDDYFIYTLVFELSYEQNMKQCLTDNTQVRDGYFNYAYNDANQAEATILFRFYNNWESAGAADFKRKEVTRKLRTNGVEKAVVSGIEIVTLDCWIIGEPIKDIEAYFFNYIAGSGPLGKQGTLNLNGVEYKKAVMTSFRGEPVKASEEDKSTAKYEVQFKVSLQC